MAETNLIITNPADMTISTKEALALTIGGGPSRTYVMESGDAGPTKCPSCDNYSVANIRVESTFPEEEKWTEIGQKCLWCEWKKIQGGQDGKTSSENIPHKEADSSTTEAGEA